MIVNVVRVQAKQGGESKLQELLKTLAREALERTDSGIQDFVVCRSRGDPGCFLLYETFNEESDLEAQRATASVQRFLSEAEPVLEDMTAELWDPVA